MHSNYEAKKYLAVSALAEIDPTKPYGTELFNAIARLSVTVALEIVCLRENPPNKQIEILMIQRSIKDAAYPGEWHCPGAVKRPGETDLEVINRLNKKELKAEIISFDFVGNCEITEEVRGHFYDPVYLCQIKQTPETKGTWFPIDSLPESTVNHHRDSIIPMAIEFYTSKR